MVTMMFMDRLEDNDVAQWRNQFSESLERTWQRTPSLLSLVTLADEPDIWDLQLQAAKEAIEQHSLTPEALRSLVQKLDLHMATAEKELIKHIASYSLQSKIVENLPRILELGRLAICGHRVCWHVEHVLRNLSERSLTALDVVTLALPDNRRLSEFLRLASGPIGEPLHYIVNRGQHFRSFGFERSSRRAQKGKRPGQPHSVLECTIEYRYLRLSNGLKVLLSSDPAAKEVNTLLYSTH